MQVADSGGAGGPTSILGATIVEDHVTAAGGAGSGEGNGPSGGDSAAGGLNAAGDAGSDDGYADMATFEEEDLAEDDAVSGKRGGVCMCMCGCGCGG